MLVWGSDVDITAAVHLISLDTDADRLRTLECSRVLIVLTTPLGDTLFAGPAVRAVRARYPGAHITALGLPSNAAILRRYPEIDEVIICNLRSRWSSLAKLLRLAALLRRQSFDLCIEM